MSEGFTGPQPLVVFVVEDEVMIQPVLVDPLEEAGYQVLVASSGAEAIKLLEGQAAGSIRALVTDVKLGPSSPSGWDVARRAREVMPISRSCMSRATAPMTGPRKAFRTAY